jgi:hypothetical protein
MSHAARMLLNFQDTVKDSVVPFQALALDDKPEQLQALATFNTGFSTVNKLHEFKNFFFHRCAYCSRIT